ncbi:MAG TPA: maleylpyruvate isomerase family mycothiol-dependent enzyme, partial [Micromonosporaceae bacterium]|nr:maleylpyruvate isomerase family mycothiol-dependent enzyme [Micromonosporaceae bacterium]
MEFTSLTEHLNRDYARLRAAVAAADPAAPVPSCPGWTVDDLAGHVTEVYLHKVECIKQRKFPDAWPPEREPAPLTTQLDTAWTRLIEQFATHEANDPAATWHDPDQTVGFWIRRMAQETVIHRIDAQLAAGVAVDAIPDDLALDDVDEVLHLFIGYASTRWPGEFAAHLESPDTR